MSVFKFVFSPFKCGEEGRTGGVWNYYKWDFEPKSWFLSRTVEIVNSNSKAEERFLLGISLPGEPTAHMLGILWWQPP